MYDEKFCRMWEFYLISAEMMFRTGSQEVFHMQLSKTRNASPIVRDYIVEEQKRLMALENTWTPSVRASAAGS
jgi:cyclopropane-fatty-acyl-phospholipid synthase